MRGFRSVMVAILFAVGLGLLGLSQLPAGPAVPRAHAANHNVNIISGGNFSPSTLTIKQGDTVTFVNTTGSVQSATAQLGALDPGYFNTGWIYGGQSVCAKGHGSTSCYTFPATGTFTYYNNNQPAPQPTGTIIVEPDSGGGGSNTPTATATSSGGGGGGAANHNVNIISGGQFSPSTLTIKQGDTVTFVNTTGTVQSATAKLGALDPGYFNTGWIYGGQSVCAKGHGSTSCYTFPATGTFAYENRNQATPYPTGTIIVEPSSGGGGGGATNTPPPTSTFTPVPPTSTPPPTQTPGGPSATPAATFTPSPTLAPGQPTHTPSATPTKTPTPPSGQQPTATPKSGPPGPNGFPAMSSGWNLVIYSGSGAPPANALSGLGQKYTVVYHWNGTSYQRFVRPGAAPAYLNTMTWMSPGSAYWIFLTAPAP